MVKEVLSENPDPFIMEIGAGLLGIPGVLHHRVIRRSTGTTRESIQQPSQVDSPSGESTNG